MSQVQVSLTFASIDLALAALALLGGSPAAAVVSTEKAPAPKSAPTPPTKGADAKPSAAKKDEAKTDAPKTPPAESSGPTLQDVTDAINAALKPGPQNRPKVVAVLAEFKTAEDGPVTNAKLLQAKDYAEFLAKLKITMDPGAAANGDDLT